MSERKTVLLLGGSAQQVVAIEAARARGYRTVLCDYLEDNPGQYVADSFHLVSTTDREAVLDVARQERVDGVLAYASDPAALTAAYVAEKLGLPTNPLSSVEIMSQKHLFRAFLRDNGFPCPRAIHFPSDAANESVLEFLETMQWPIVVKPTDSSGSKGVTIIESLDDFSSAIDYAASFSRNGLLIAEEYIQRAFPQIVGGDIFVVDGVVCFWGLMSCLRDQRFPLVPVGEYLPSGMSVNQQKACKDTLQRLVSALGLRFGEFNVELLLGPQDVPYVLELGARAGGNMIPLQLSDAYGIDLVDANVAYALGEDSGRLVQGDPNGCVATYVLHGDRSGVFCGLSLSALAEACCYKSVLYQEFGSSVHPMEGAHRALGILFFRFDTEEQMQAFLGQIERHVRVRIS